MTWLVDIIFKFVFFNFDWRLEQIVFPCKFLCIILSFANTNKHMCIHTICTHIKYMASADSHLACHKWKSAKCNVTWHTPSFNVHISLSNWLRALTLQLLFWHKEHCAHGTSHQLQQLGELLQQFLENDHVTS